MNKTALYVVGGIVLFLAWRNGTASQAMQDRVASAVPYDPYGNYDWWQVLNGPTPNASPSQADVDLYGMAGFGGVGTCPPGAFC